jgi:hypothetical protein
MSPRSKKIVAVFVGALATLTTMGAGSAAAKTPPPKQALVAQVASDRGIDNKQQSDDVFQWSFKPRK